MKFSVIQISDFSSNSSLSRQYAYTSIPLEASEM